MQLFLFNLYRFNGLQCNFSNNHNQNGGKILRAILAFNRCSDKNEIHSKAEKASLETESVKNFFSLIHKNEQ